ncbi:MAG TPA: META domain-containing protein [Anaerolineales bacterium]|jgi:heat shock protein HslJ
MLNLSRRWVVPVLVLVAALTGCGVPPSDQPLHQTSWQLENFNGEDPVGDRPLTLNFVDGQATGGAGCNSFGGNYRQQSNLLTFSELTRTLMACPGAQGVMDQEQAYLEALGAVERFELRNGSLVLLTGSGELLVFSQTSP